MASIQSAVEIIISGTDLASTVLKEVGYNSSQLGSSFRQTAYEMDGVKSAINETDSAYKKLVSTVDTHIQTIITATSVAGGLATLMAGVGLNAAREYEVGLTNVKRVFNETPEEIEKYVDQLKDVGTTYGQTSSSMLEALANFGEAGYTIKESAELIKTSLTLAGSANLTAGQSAEYLIRILKGFKVPAEETAETANRVGNIINGLANSYATNAKELADAMAGIGPIANQMGFSLEQTASLAVPMIEVFGSGSEAANALKVGLLKLVDDSAPVKSALQSIGVSQYELNGNLRQGSDILFDVMQRFNGLTDSQKSFVTQQLVGVEQSARLTEVFSQQSKVLEIEKVALSSTTSMMDEMAKKMGTLDFAIQKNKASFNAFATSIGNEFRVEATGVVDSLTELNQAFQLASESKGFDQVYSALRGYLTDIQTFISKVADSIPEAFNQVDWSSLLEGVDDLGAGIKDALQSIFGEIDITTIEGLRTAIQGISDVLGVFMSYVGGVAEGFDLGSPAISRFTGFLNLLSNDMAKGIGTAEGFIYTLNNMLSMLNTFANTALPAISGMLKFAGALGLATLALKTMSAAGIPVGAMFANLATGVQFLIGRFLALNPITASIVASLFGLQGATIALVGASGAAGYAIGTVLYDALSKTMSAISGSDTSLGSAIYDVVENIKGWLGISELERKSLETTTEKAREQAKVRREAQQAQLEASKKEQEEREKSHQAWLKENDAVEMAIRERENLKKIAEDLGLTYDAENNRVVNLTTDYDKNANASLRVVGALSALGVNFKEVTNQITDDGAKIIGNFEKLATDISSSSVVIQAGFESAIPKASNLAELEKLENIYQKAFESGKVGAEQFSYGMALLNVEKQKLLEALPGLERGLNELGVESSQEFKNTAERYKTNFEEIKKSGKATTGELQDGFLKLAEAEINSALASGNTIPEYLKQEAVVLGLKDTLDLLIKKKTEEQQAYQRIDQKANDRISQIEKESDVIDKQVSAQVDNLRASERLAEAKGDEKGARQSNISAMEVELSGLHSKLKAKEQEIEVTRTAYFEKYAEANADQVITEAESNYLNSVQQTIEGKEAEADSIRSAIKEKQAEIQTSKDQNKTQEDANDTNEKAVKTYSLMESAAERGAREITAMSAGTRELMYAGLGLVDSYKNTSNITSESLEKLRSHLAGVNDAISWNKKIITASTDSYDGYVRAVNNTWKAFDEQAIRAEELTVQLQEMGQSGKVSMTLLNEAVKGVSGGFNLLDAERLTNLKNAIEGAKEKVDELNNATIDARKRIKELDAELLEAKGLTKQADLLKTQIDLEEQLAEIERQRQDALAKGNNDLIVLLDEQKNKLQELNKIKINNIEEESKAEKEAINDRESENKKSSIDTANATASAWTNVSSSIKNAKSSLEEFSNFDLSRVNSQLSDMLSNLDKARTATR